MRIRPTTWAMLWYPLVCAALAAGFGAWLWSQCGDVQRVAACRSDIVPGMLMFFVAILAVGMVVLAVVWLIGRVIGRRPSASGSLRPPDPGGGLDGRTDTTADAGAQADPDSDPARRG